MRSIRVSQKRRTKIDAADFQTVDIQASQQKKLHFWVLTTGPWQRWWIHRVTRPYGKDRPTLSAISPNTLPKLSPTLTKKLQTQTGNGLGRISKIINFEWTMLRCTAGQPPKEWCGCTLGSFQEQKDRCSKKLNGPTCLPRHQSGEAVGTMTWSPMPNSWLRSLGIIKCRNKICGWRKTLWTRRSTKGAKFFSLWRLYKSHSCRTASSLSKATKKEHKWTVVMKFCVAWNRKSC